MLSTCMLQLWLSAMESVELKTLRQYIPHLKYAIKHNVKFLNKQLFDFGLITLKNYDKLKNSKESPDTQATTLLEHVKNKVSGDKSNYHTFVNILSKEHIYHDIVRRLDRTYYIYKLQGDYAWYLLYLWVSMIEF